MLYLPSILAKSTMGEAILFGVCLTEVPGLWGPLGWKPAQAIAGAAAAAEVTGTEAASSCLPRDGADVGAASNTVAGARGGSRIFGWGKCQRHEDRVTAGAEGAPPHKFFINCWS